MAYAKNFDFDGGSLMRNLATFEEKAQDFLDADIDVHAVEGEVALKTRAPWRDRTTNARRGLWARSENMKRNGRYSISMGHTEEYGIYLEESNDGRFQVVMPVLLATARSFMRSLEHMFAQMQTHTPAGVAIPGGGARQGTSQGVKERTTGADSKPDVRVGFDKRGRAFARNAQGRFVSLKAKVAKEVTKRTKRTRRG